MKARSLVAAAALVALSPAALADVATAGDDRDAPPGSARDGCPQVDVPTLAGCDKSAGVPVTGTGAAALSLVEGESLDGKILAYLADKGAPGATVAITKDSRLVWAKGYGYADATTNRLMQPETRSRIGSVSKMLTAIAAMALVEDGSVDLDQHVYGASAVPLWGADRGATPGVVVAPGGVLEDPGAYLEAMVAGVDNLGEYFPPSEHLDEMPSLNWALLNQAAYEQQITTVLDRASSVQVRHLVSHTAGHPKSASGADDAAAEVFGVDVDDVTSGQMHQAFLMGLSDAGAPFVFDPGTQEKYSNRGFSVAGHIIAAASPQGDYRAFVEAGLLEPLGLADVVPNNAEISDLDAQPHGADDLPYPVDHDNGLDPQSVSRLGLATGGWSASARDLTRVMCSIDQHSNNLRALDQATVELMAADAVPGAAGVNPIGWDSASATELTKNGDIGGGTARISKFLPGAFDEDDAEINVAVAVNKGDVTPSSDFLRDLAEIAATADIPPEFDLFDPAHACILEVETGLSGGPQVPTPVAPIDRTPMSQPPSDVTTPTPPAPTDEPASPDHDQPRDDPANDDRPSDEQPTDDPRNPSDPQPDPTLPGPAILVLGADLACDAARRTLVEARIEAPAGVESASLRWRAGALAETTALLHDEERQLWVATVMPDAIDVTVIVTDVLGRTATAAANPTCVPAAAESGTVTIPLTPAELQS